jgi:hypothetical protein
MASCAFHVLLLQPDKVQKIRRKTRQLWFTYFAWLISCLDSFITGFKDYSAIFAFVKPAA